MAAREQDGTAGWELVLPDGRREALTGTLTVGRGPDNDLRLADRSVSRSHARFELWPDGPLLDDAGSSHGTFIDGRRVKAPTLVRDGGRVRLGEVELVLERVRGRDEAARTIMVQAGATSLQAAIADAAPADGADPAVQAAATQFGMRPRVRSGWALKRLDVSEGDRRFVLKDLRTNTFVRMTEAEAELFELLDGSRTLVDLIGEAERRLGPMGAGRLAALLADLGDRGLLAGVDRREVGPATGRLARLMTPREIVLPWAGRVVDAVYGAGGRALMTRPAGVVALLLSVLGLAAFAYLVARRYGTPFVVASHVGIGGLVFIGGRFALVAVHELAHGLAVASCGRHVRRAGIKIVGIFPYGFVDTSDAWFEPRRRRLLITGAGPIADFTLGGIFALASLGLGAGTTRDVFFQLAFGALVGAFTNLNPVLDRDGYGLLVDTLREPGLRQRSRAYLRARLGGKAGEGEVPRAVRIYSLMGLAWMVLGALFILVMVSRYYDGLVAISGSEAIVRGLFVGLTLMLFAPVFLVLGRGLLDRRQREPDDGDA